WAATLSVVIRGISWRCPSDSRSAPPRSVVISARTSRNRRAQGPRASASTNSARPLVTRERKRDEPLTIGGRSPDEFSSSIGMVWNLGCGWAFVLEKTSKGRRRWTWVGHGKGCLPLSYWYD